MRRSNLSIIILSLISIIIFCGVANAYWIWTPETKKFINPKNAVKDSPKEQFDWAMGFYDAKDFQRAATEFEKLAKQYEFSEHASKAQYYVGLCNENMNKYYIAFQNYQKAIDNFPHIANTEEILAREFAIGNLYLGKPGPKVLGTDIMAPLDRAVEIFKKVVENAPYGKYAEESQFKLGEALKKSNRYEEAVQAFHKLVEDYPHSKLITKAMYEESDCAYKASLKPAYDAAATDNAIKTFEKFTYKNKDSDLAKTADTTMKRLKDNVSEKSFRAAEFYESQGKAQAAIIYYQDVIDSYPDSIFVDRAKAKMEALKARANKKASPPIDLSKKKPKQVAKETPKKEPWKPLSLWNEKLRSKEKAEVTATAPKTPRKSSWNLFKFGAKKEPSAKESPQKKEWKPLSFDTKKESVVKETPKEKSSWGLFKFGAKKEPVAKETPKKKAWKPLSFDAKKEEANKPVEAPIIEAQVVQVKTEEVAPPAVKEPEIEPVTQTAEVIKAEPPAAQVMAEEAPQAEPPAQIAKTPKKKEWKPLSFDVKRESVAKEAPKRWQWKPLNFGTNDDVMGIKK